MGLAEWSRPTVLKPTLYEYSPGLAPGVRKDERKLSGIRDSQAAKSGIGHQQMDVVTQGATELLGLVPFARYLVPQERERFMQLDRDEQVSALAWETAGAALFVGGGVIAKYGGKAVNKLQQTLQEKKLLKFLPIEDAIEHTRMSGGIWRGFDHRGEVKQLLKGRQFAQDEAEVIGQFVTGNIGEEGLKAIAWEKGKTLSGAWKKSIGQLGDDIGDGVLRKQLSIPEELKQLLTPEASRARYARKLYKENLKVLGPNANVHHVENMVKYQIETVFGKKQIEGFSLGHISEPEMANVISSMFAPEGKKAIGAMHRLAVGRWTFPWFRPERDVYGAGEALFRTKSGIFDRLVNANAAANGYKLDKLNTFMEMLQQRGFGTIKVGEAQSQFIPNPAQWNDEVLEGTRKVLTKIDNLAESARRGTEIDKQVIQQEIGQILDNLKGDSPIVMELVNITREYTDVLYKDMLQLYVPKLLDDVFLNQKGKSTVEQLSKYWGQQAEGVFKSNSTKTAVDKIEFTKQLLKDFKSVLKNPENLLPEAKGQQKLIGNILKSLEYGSTHHAAVPKYLEGYMPRVAERGTNFANFSKRTLIGEAGYMKARQSEISGKLVQSFQEMIEARTSAQAKQLYFYNEAEKAIQHAQSLPEAWRKHTDFTMSRMMGQPSDWDYKVATMLSKITGQEFDGHRAMRAAKTITGMSYTGLLGLRPFAVFRNLTQTPLMTPVEMGGTLRDGYALIRGFGSALTKETREYVKSIGAIAEYVPDQQFKPMLPQLGWAAKYDNMRDAFMYFFKESDKFNRYWSGGAALEKWNWASKQVRPDDVVKFSKKLGLQHREPWARSEIENLLKLGRVDEAKAKYVTNIIADSQFLYSSADAPAATGMGGAQKLVTTFHSWWMNYGSALSRWATTGQADERIKKLGMFMMSAAMVEQVLEMWVGKRSAMISVGLGPLPMGDVGLPPALQPVIQLMSAAKNTIQGYTWDDEKSRQLGEQSFYKALKSAAGIAVPGGLAIQQIGKGISNEGVWPGAITGWLQKSDEKFRPMWDR